MNPPSVPALGLDLNLSLKLGLEHRFGVRKSGSRFSAPSSFLGDSWLKLNFLGNDLALGESASMRSTQDWATMVLDVSGVLRP